jgi:hypothetical protein
VNAGQWTPKTSLESKKTMLALTLSILAQVDPRPVWVPLLTFPEPAYTVSVLTLESVTIRSGTYEVSADLAEREFFSLDMEVKGCLY